MKVLRYVITYTKDGELWQIFGGANKSSTFTTPEEAQERIETIRRNNSASTLAMFGVPDTLTVCQVECWPHSGDPVGSIWYEERAI